MQFWFSSSWNALTALAILLAGLALTLWAYRRPQSRMRILYLTVTLLVVFASSFWLGAVLQSGAIDPIVHLR